MKKSLAFAGLALICATPVLADNTDQATVTVSGAIVAPLTITSTGTLKMPHLVAPNASDPVATTTVTVTCGDGDANNTIAYTNNGNPFAKGSAGAGSYDTGSANYGIGSAGGIKATGECAALTVNGQTDYFFATVAAVGTTTVNNGVTLSDPACHWKNGAAMQLAGGAGAATNTKIGATGTVLRCGAKVSAAIGATDYSGQQFTVTVTYD